MTRRCLVCGAELTGRAHARTCSARCRKALQRDPTLALDAQYVVTEEDRAAMRRVLERDGCGHPGPVLTPDAVRAHVAAHAIRT